MNKITLRNLRTVALYTGAFSLAGAIYITYKIQSNFKKEAYYKKSIDLLKGYPPAVRLLGEPIRAKRLDLGNTEETYSDGLKARLAIPLVGQRRKGTLHSWSSRSSLENEWMVEKCDLDIEGKYWTFYLSPNSTEKATILQEDTEIDISDTNVNTEDTTCVEIDSQSRESDNSKKDLFYLNVK